MTIVGKVEAFAGILVAASLACGVCYWAGHHAGYASGQQASAAKVAACESANAQNADTIKQLKAANAQFADTAHDAQEAAAAAVNQQAADAKVNAAKLASAQRKLQDAEHANTSARTWADSPVPAGVADSLRE